MAQDLDTQVNVKMPKRLLVTLREIEKHHGISPADALRRLGEEMARYYAEHGWFSFPVRIEPRLELIPPGKIVDIWKLDPEKEYYLDGDDVVTALMLQLRVPNLFARMVEHDQVHSFVAFDDHPSHWIVLHLWKGLPTKDGNGLFFEALPKSSVTRAEVLKKLKAVALEMGSKQEIRFSQRPAEIRQEVGNKA